MTGRVEFIVAWGRPGRSDWEAVRTLAYDADEAKALVAGAHPDRFRPPYAFEATAPPMANDPAGTLRRLHYGPDPLLLANVWDAAGARIVETAGFPAVATSSGAVAKAHGYEDDDCMPVDVAFGVVAEIAHAVSVPVTADIEAGYGLGPDELVERLLGAGAVGCNFEDTDHRGAAPLVEAEEQATRIAAVKDAGRRAGVDIVVNARIDVFVNQVGLPERQVPEMVRRGRLYLEAGADCVYPIAVTDGDAIRALVDGIPGPVNAMLRRGAPSLAEMREIGVARVSVGSGLFGVTTRALVAAVEALVAGEADGLWHR